MADPFDFQEGGPTDRGCADGYTVRWLREEDEAVLREIHRRQRATAQFDYAWPDLFGDRRYFRVFVLERAGNVEGCLVAHATTEIFVIADRPRVLRALLRRRNLLAEALRQAGADELHAFVPRALLARMRHFLARMGMRRSTDRCVTYYREL